MKVIACICSNPDQVWLTIGPSKVRAQPVGSSIGVTWINHVEGHNVCEELSKIHRDCAMWCDIHGLVVLPALTERKGCLDEMFHVDAWVLTEENRNRELEFDIAEL